MQTSHEKLVTSHDAKEKVHILHQTRLASAQAISLMNEIRVSTDLMNKWELGDKAHVQKLIACTNDLQKYLLELHNIMLKYNNGTKSYDVVFNVKQACFTLRSCVVDSDRIFREILGSQHVLNG
jgi:hypothetical protein